MPNTKKNDQKTSGNNNNKTGNNIKQGSASSITNSSPTAREKAKDMDSKRRSDAESNEL